MCRREDADGVRVVAARASNVPRSEVLLLKEVYDARSLARSALANTRSQTHRGRRRFSSRKNPRGRARPGRRPIPPSAPSASSAAQPRHPSRGFDARVVRPARRRARSTPGARARARAGAGRQPGTRSRTCPRSPRAARAAAVAAATAALRRKKRSPRRAPAPGRNAPRGRPPARPGGGGAPIGGHASTSRSFPSRNDPPRGERPRPAAPRAPEKKRNASRGGDSPVFFGAGSGRFGGRVGP